MQIRRVILSAASTLILSGCVSTTSSPETNAAIDAAVDCVIRQSQLLDDRTSDAVTIAYGAVGACDTEIRGAERATSAGLPFDSYPTVRRRLSEWFLKKATELVLFDRAHPAK